MIDKRAFFSSTYHIQTSNIYVLGGNSGNRDFALCETYSVVENYWKPIAPMNCRRNGSSCISLENYLFVFGGNQLDIGSVDSIEKYSIDLNKWSICRIRLRQAVHDSLSFYLGGNRVLIFGGQLEKQLNQSYDIYDLTIEIM